MSFATTKSLSYRNMHALNDRDDIEYIQQTDISIDHNVPNRTRWWIGTINKPQSLPINYDIND